MLFIGLTGGIGSGKSEALAACRRAGAAVLSSDQIVHELLGTDEVRDLLAARWGDAIRIAPPLYSRGDLHAFVVVDLERGAQTVIDQRAGELETGV